VVETTDFFFQVYRFIYSAASGIFILSSVLSALYYVRFREKFAGIQLGLSLCLLFYTLSAFVYTFGTPPAFYNRILLSIVYIVGWLTFVFYIRMVTRLLGISPPWLPYLINPIRIIPIAVVIDLIQSQFSNQSFFIHLGGAGELKNPFMSVVYGNIHIDPTIFIVFIPASFCFVAISLLLIFQYKKEMEREPLLKYGILSMLLTQTHDLSITFFDFKYLIPLGFAGYLLEIVRFNMSLLKNYLIHNDAMKARLKDSILSFAQVRLSRQVLHDVKSVRRNILYALEENHPDSPAKDRLNAEINRLRVYEGGPIGPKEKLVLQEMVDLTLSLFTKELLEKNIRVRNLIPPNLHVDMQRQDLLIVLINLIQNSIDAVNKNSEPWVRFTAHDYEDKVQLKIRDSGQISIEDSAQLFQIGYSSKGNKRGIGLNIAQEALAANSSLISLCSKSENTTFILDFYKTDDDSN